MFTKPTGVRSSILVFGKDVIDLPNRWLAIRTTADRCKYSKESCQPPLPFIATDKVWEIQDIEGKLIHFWVEDLENFYKTYGCTKLLKMLKNEFKFIEKPIYETTEITTEYPWIESKDSLYSVDHKTNKKLCVATERLWS